jgi:carbamoyltransferase
MIEWGVSFGSHDAALTVIDDNQVKFASHSERFSKIKDDPNLSAELISHAINCYGNPTQVFYYENPRKKKLRYLQSGQYKHIFESSPKRVLQKFGINAPITYIDHHYSHAAAGYYTSSFTDATVVVIDAIGEMATTTIWQANGNKIIKKYQQDYPHSIGLLYSSLTQAAGFKPNGEEFIFMGLAAYGKPDYLYEELMNSLIKLNDKQPLVELRKNLHKGCIDYIPRDISPADLAAAGQKMYEVCLQKLLSWAYTNLPSRNLVLMGGCALNCVANSKITEWNTWKNIWIMPNPGDAGSSLGACLAGIGNSIVWPGPYLGYNISKEYPVEQIVNYLANDTIVAVANGRAEFGPRALGNRSIFADPRKHDIKNQMNWLKKRESFRPFAAVITEDLAPQFFNMKDFKSSPYMQFVFECKYPEKYPGIAHKDNSCRIQTVSYNQHPQLYKMLNKWYEKSGCPMLVNTSLNIKNQPLVNDECDAYEFQKEYNIPVL